MNIVRPALIALSLTACAIVADAQDKPTATSLAPAGQGPGVNASSPAISGRSARPRAQVKAETRSAERSRQLSPAGEAANPAGSGNPEGDKTMTRRGSAKSRAAVKAETRAAERAGALQPAGEAPRPYTEPPKP